MLREKDMVRNMARIGSCRAIVCKIDSKLVQNKDVLLMPTVVHPYVYFPLFHRILYSPRAAKMDRENMTVDGR